MANRNEWPTAIAVDRGPSGNEHDQTTASVRQHDRECVDLTDALALAERYLEREAAALARSINRYLDAGIGFDNETQNERLGQLAAKLGELRALSMVAASRGRE